MVFITGLNTFFSIFTFCQIYDHYKFLSWNTFSSFFRCSWVMFHFLHFFNFRIRNLNQFPIGCQDTNKS